MRFPVLHRKPWHFPFAWGINSIHEPFDYLPNSTINADDLLVLTSSSNTETKHVGLSESMSLARRKQIAETHFLRNKVSHIRIDRVY